MTKEHLPVFQIQDFESQRQREPEFYLSALSRHLQKHQFIQKPHKHDFYILLLITSGTGTHLIDFAEYGVKPGRVFFLGPGQVHSWELSEDTEGYICFFKPDFYRAGFPDKRLTDYPFFNPLLKPLLDLPEEQKPLIHTLIRQMEEEHAALRWKSLELIRNLLDILLIRLTRVYQQQHTIQLPTAGHYTVLQQLEELVEKHYKQHQPVSFYAGRLHLTPRQLNESCRHSLGKTTSELIQDRVILEARRLLTHSGLTITQIAAELGYFDNSYFSRFYKKRTGETPEQFRAGL